MKREPEVEKRKHPRCKVEKDMYVAIKDNTFQVGIIADISLDGLSFNYLEDIPLTLDQGDIDIFTSGKRFYIPNIPVKVIYKNRQKPNDEEFSFITINQCGVAFDRLNENQTTQIAALLDDHQKNPPRF